MAETTEGVVRGEDTYYPAESAAHAIMPVDNTAQAMWVCMGYSGKPKFYT